MWIATPQPGVALARVLAAVGGHARSLRSVDVVRPSLESVFFALTGRRYESEDEESSDVVPA